MSSPCREDCGAYDIVRMRADAQARITAQYAAAARGKAIRWCLCLAVLGILIGYLRLCGPEGRARMLRTIGSAVSQAGGSKGNFVGALVAARAADTDAALTAQECVREKLKYGETVYVCGRDDIQVEDLGHGRRRLSGWVDSPDSSGMQARSDWVAVLRAAGNGTWVVESVEVNAKDEG
jgi:hypothetical protein